MPMEATREGKGHQCHGPGNRAQVHSDRTKLTGIAYEDIHAPLTLGLRYCLGRLCQRRF